MDALKGATLTLAFLGTIAICATLLQIWYSTWQAAVEQLEQASTRLAWVHRNARRLTGEGG
jgi:hypothetical protein